MKRGKKTIKEHEIDAHALMLVFITSTLLKNNTEVMNDCYKIELFFIHLKFFYSWMKIYFKYLGFQNCYKYLRF